MGTKSTPRPKARVPDPPTERLRGAGPTGQTQGICPDQFTISLTASRLAAGAIGEPVAIREASNGDLVAVHATLGPVGRLADLPTWTRRCLQLNEYVGVVEGGGGDGPQVQLTRVADR